MQRSKNQEEHECSICLDSLPTSNFTRMICCGKGLHKKCYHNMKVSSMSYKQKNQCIMCRTIYPKSGEEEIKQLRPWVEKGQAWAQSILGDNYRDNQSYQKARELWELAASQGNADAQYNLGTMYIHSQGVDQNYERAAEYYEAAAMQGMAEAQNNLGALYWNGQGVEQSNETAHELWMKSAEQGNEDAIEHLQKLDKHEGRTTPSFTPPKQCSTCDAPKTATHKLNDCPCKGAQYCNTKCQAAHWKSHKKKHRRLCKEMKLKKTEEEERRRKLGFNKKNPWSQEKEDKLKDELNSGGSGFSRRFGSSQGGFGASFPAAASGFSFGSEAIPAGGFSFGSEATPASGFSFSSGAASSASGFTFGSGASSATPAAAPEENGFEMSDKMKDGVLVEDEGETKETASADLPKAQQQEEGDVFNPWKEEAPKPFECATCFRPHDPPEHKLRPCNGCHRVFYCSKECQVKHWKRERNGHKKQCNSEKGNRKIKKIKKIKT